MSTILEWLAEAGCLVKIFGHNQDLKDRPKPIRKFLMFWAKKTLKTPFRAFSLSLTRAKTYDTLSHFMANKAGSLNEIRD